MIFVYQEIFQQFQVILAGDKLQYVRDSKFYQLLPEKRTLKLPKLIIITACGMSSFVLVNLKPCCTEMFVLYSSHYCLFMWSLWSQIIFTDKIGICLCCGAMLCELFTIILCWPIPSCLALLRMFCFMVWQISFHAVTYSGYVANKDVDCASCCYVVAWIVSISSYRGSN